jgi:protease-4
MKRFVLGLLSSLGIFFLILIIGTWIFIRSQTSTVQGVEKNSILYIEFTSRLVEYKDSAPLWLPLTPDSQSLKDIIDAIDTAASDPNIIGIIARLDHLQMGIAQVQEIRSALMRFRVLGHSHNKFAIAFTDTFGEMQQSTVSYYLASGFDEIWIQPMGIVGFTGLVWEVPFAKKLMDKLQLKPQIYRREEYKSAYETFTEEGFTAPNKEASRASLDSMMGQIIHDVALDRELTKSEVKTAVNRAPLLGNEAIKLGMVDRIGYFDELLQNQVNKIRANLNLVSPKDYLLRTDNLRGPKADDNNRIALIYGVGNIYRDDPDQKNKGLWPTMNMGSNAMSQAIKDAAEDPRVKAIVLRLNSPGGSPIGSETIWRSIMQAKKVQKKPIIVSMSDMAGSGAYWIITHANKIVAHPATLTGSIGVIGGKIITNEAWQELGINWDNVHVGENALMWNNSESYTPLGEKRIQAWLDDLYETFIHRVAEGRKLSVSHVRQIAKGRIWTGEEALKLGLVDKLGGLHTAIDLAKVEAGLQNQKVHVAVYPERPSFAVKIFDLLFDASISMGQIGSYINEVAPSIREIQTSLTPRQTLSAPMIPQQN